MSRKAKKSALAGPGKMNGAAFRPPPDFTQPCLRSVRDRCLGIRRECRIDLCPAQEVERHVERLVVFGLRRNIGLRAGLLFALVALQVAAQRCLTFGISL